MLLSVRLPAAVRGQARAARPSAAGRPQNQEAVMRDSQSTARTGDGAAAPMSSARRALRSIYSKPRPAEPPPPEMPAGNAARVRQRILAIFLPVTAVLYVGCEALDPKGTDQVVTTVAAGLKLLV